MAYGVNTIALFVQIDILKLDRQACPKCQSLGFDTSTEGTIPELSKYP